MIKRFDRHSIFRENELSIISNTIRFVSDYKYNHKDSEDLFDVENYLYGLYDGFLYEELKPLVDKFISLDSLKNDIEKVIKLAESKAK